MILYSADNASSASLIGLNMQFSSKSNRTLSDELSSEVGTGRAEQTHGPDHHHECVAADQLRSNYQKALECGQSAIVYACSIIKEKNTSYAPKFHTVAAYHTFAIKRPTM